MITLKGQTIKCNLLTSSAINTHFAIAQLPRLRSHANMAGPLQISILIVAACSLATADNNIFTNLLPNIASHFNNGPGASPAVDNIAQIGSIVGDAYNFAQKRSYEQSLRHVAETTSEADLVRVSEELFKADVNNVANQITINFQGKTTSVSPNDVSPGPLLTVPQSVWNMPTIKDFVSLIDNFHKNVLRPEFSLPAEDNEQTNFLHSVLATPVMRYVMNYFVEKGIPELRDITSQVDLLKKIWFEKYSRDWIGVCKCSCAFENVFLSELKFKEVLGLHNWVYFANRESINKANYLGFMDSLNLNGKGTILKFHFTLSEKDKPDDTMFVGTSPELELALYTLCFVTRADSNCPLSADGVRFSIVTKTRRDDGKYNLDTAYPTFPPYT